MFFLEQLQTIRYIATLIRSHKANKYHTTCNLKNKARRCRKNCDCNDLCIYLFVFVFQLIKYEEESSVFKDTISSIVRFCEGENPCKDSHHVKYICAQFQINGNGGLFSEC